VTIVVPLDASAAPSLAEFLAGLPEGERRWFREDVSDPSVAHAWAHDGDGRVIAVAEEGRVVGYAAVEPGRGWSAHVGEITVMVAEDVRGQGVGTRLAQEALVRALRMGLIKVVVEVVAEERSAIALFRRLGFEPEALLRDHVRDRGGGLRDLMVLAHPVAENWGVMAATGVEDALV
jgi:RimJ/RimL family protein N-acetyltransferase